MKNKKNEFIVSAFILTMVVILFLGFYEVVSANSSYWAIPAKSATATSTQMFLVAASATISTSTPIVYDSYNIDGSNQTPNSGFTTNTNEAADSLALLEYVNASSTVTVYKTFIEYSDGIDASGNYLNCKTSPTACDWYDNNLDTYAAGNIAIATPNTYSYTYASTTKDTTLSAAGALENRGSKLIGVKTPLRFVRAYVVVSGANGSISLKFVPKKQLR